MATLNESRLNAAFDDGLINGDLSQNQKLYLHNSILTVNKILSIINSREDIDIEQLGKAARLDQNTCLIYCRWLQSKRLIRIIPWEGDAIDGRKIRNLYVSLKRTPGLLTGEISDSFFENLPENELQEWEKEEITRPKNKLSRDQYLEMRQLGAKLRKNPIGTINGISYKKGDGNNFLILENGEYKGNYLAGKLARIIMGISEEDYLNSHFR